MTVSRRAHAGANGYDGTAPDEALCDHAVTRITGGAGQWR